MYTFSKNTVPKIILVVEASPAVKAGTAALEVSLEYLAPFLIKSLLFPSFPSVV